MILPPELLTDLSTLQARWQGTALMPWLEQLPAQIALGMSPERYGDLPHWRDALRRLPEVAVDSILLNTASVGCTGRLHPTQRLQLEAALRDLHPWRKGPFQLFDIHIDTEWRSDWKWNRLVPALELLEDRRVLDVGCGSGYHCWRLLGAGAAEVIGIEPTPLFVLQFKALQHFLQQTNVHVLPVKLEQLPRPLKAFDTTLSMGVLYHRRSPIDHLIELRDTLRPGGQLILETLVVEGDAHTVLIPEGRYARMGNVWFLPSIDMLQRWLVKLGFKQIEVIDVSLTSTEEQRRTEWMRFHSLADFLDPLDATKTLEGHPAPRRALLSAHA